LTFDIYDHDSAIHNCCLMPDHIETVCPGCSRVLRVSAEFVGQQARCPVCNEIYAVTGKAGDLRDGDRPNPHASWRMRSPEGRLYGPVSKEDLDAWVSEGRVTPDCTIMDEDHGAWQPATELYPVLVSAIPIPDSEVKNGAVKRYRYMAPNRGGLVLSLGIVSWLVFCPAFGLAAWMMGSTDLREMRAGRVDPRAMIFTLAGQILGMIQSLICLAAVVIGLFILIARFAGW
jgi:hypothetical protein